MKVIELHDISNKEIYINIEHIVYFNSLPDNSTFISVINERGFLVSETPNTIRNMIEVLKER